MEQIALVIFAQKNSIIAKTNPNKVMILNIVHGHVFYPQLNWRSLKCCWIRICTRCNYLHLWCDIIEGKADEQNVQITSFHLHKTLLNYGRYNLEQWCFNIVISNDFHDFILITKSTRNFIFVKKLRGNTARNTNPTYSCTKNIVDGLIFVICKLKWFWWELL